MRDLPHLPYLQAFEAAARHLSFTRAAEELNCTQAAISQRVRGLEQYFGRPLFHRRANGLELSSAGKAYLPGITQALDMAEAATQGLTGRRSVRTVTVSAPVSFLNLWLAPRLAGFQACHPEVGIRLNSAIWTDPNLELADISVSVTDSTRIPPGAVTLTRERLVLVCAAGMAKALPDIGAVNALRQIEVQGKYRLWEMWAKAMGLALAPRLPAIRVDNAATALELAAAGQGATVLYATYAADAVEAGRVAAPLGPGAPVPHALVLAENTSRPAAAAGRQFAEWLSGQFPGVEREIGNPPQRP